MCVAGFATGRQGEEKLERPRSRQDIMTSEDKNSQPLHCEFCNSLILREKLGELVKQQVSATPL